MMIMITRWWSTWWPLWWIVRPPCLQPSGYLVWTIKVFWTSKSIRTNVFPAEDGDSDSEEAHPQQQNRTRQKKFVKNFKQLPSEEVVLQSESNQPKKKEKIFFSRVFLRTHVRHPTARPPLCHRELHRLPLQRLWLCHQGKHHHHHLHRHHHHHGSVPKSYFLGQI